MSQPANTLNKRHYLWQSQLLAEMGVTRWVSQVTPVEMSELDVFADTPKPAGDIAYTDAPVTDSVDAPSEILSATVDVKTTSAATSVAMPVSVAIDAATEKTLSTNYLNPPMQPMPAVNGAEMNAATTKLDLQAVVVHDWIWLVDDNYLQQQSRQRVLWQQIVANLSAEPQFFKFPMLANHAQLPASTVQLMGGINLALAGFSGFLYRLKTDHESGFDHPIKIGCLTPMPSYLQDQTIERLPYLEEMLADYRHKRQLWLLLTS